MESAAPSSTARRDISGPSWRRALLERVRRHFLIKLAGTTAYTWVFFIAYFALLRDPIHTPATMPLTALDRWIPFQPSMLVAYFSLWIYVGVAPGLQLRFVELLSYGLWIALLCVAGLALFYFYPTAIPPIAIDPGGFPGFGILKGVDAAGNACPSMHVAVAVFSAIWVDVLLVECGAPRALRLVNAAWLLAIVWSTLAVKQHVVLDALAGALLGTAFALASIACRPQRVFPATARSSSDAKGSAEASAIIGGSEHRMKRNAAQ